MKSTLQVAPRGVKPRKKRKIQIESGYEPVKVDTIRNEIIIEKKEVPVQGKMYWFEFVAQLTPREKRFILPFKLHCNIVNEKEEKDIQEWQKLFDEMMTRKI